MIKHRLIDFVDYNGWKLKIKTLAPRGGLESVANLAPSGAET